MGEGTGEGREGEGRRCLGDDALAFVAPSAPFLATTRARMFSAVPLAPEYPHGALRVGMPFGSALAATRARLCICLATTSERRLRSRSSSASASSTSRRVSASASARERISSSHAAASPRDAPPRNEDARATVLYARNPTQTRTRKPRKTRARIPPRGRRRRRSRSGREIASRRRPGRTRREAPGNPRVGRRRPERRVPRGWTGRFPRDAEPRARRSPPRPRPLRIRGRRRRRLGAPSPPPPRGGVGVTRRLGHFASGEFRAKRRDLATRLGERDSRGRRRRGSNPRRAGSEGRI